MLGDLKQWLDEKYVNFLLKKWKKHTSTKFLQNQSEMYSQPDFGFI